MISRRKGGYTISAELQVPKSASKEPPHVDFANLSGTRESVEQFAKLWGRLFGDWKYLKLPRILSFRDRLRDAWESAEHPFLHEQVMGAKVTITKKGVELEPFYLLSTIWLLFVRDSWAGKTAICANPDCPNPYFIRKRKTQKYCEAGPCVNEALKGQKLKWWKNNRGKDARNEHLQVR